MMFVSALLALSALAYGQDRGAGSDFARQWQERIESEKIAFLTNEMSLTTKEAQAFWPLYNQAQKEQREAVENTMKAYMALDKALREGKTGKEVDTLLDRYLKAIEAQNVSSKYAKEYLKVLPADKVARLFIGEEKFRQSQIHRLRQPMGGGGQPGMFGGGRPQQPQSQEGK